MSEENTGVKSVVTRKDDDGDQHKTKECSDAGLPESVSERKLVAASLAQRDLHPSRRSRSQSKVQPTAAMSTIPRPPKRSVSMPPKLLAGSFSGINESPRRLPSRDMPRLSPSPPRELPGVLESLNRSQDLAAPQSSPSETSQHLATPSRELPQLLSDLVENSEVSPGKLPESLEQDVSSQEFSSSDDEPRAEQGRQQLKRGRKSGSEAKRQKTLDSRNDGGDGASGSRGPNPQHDSEGASDNRGPNPQHNSQVQSSTSGEAQRPTSGIAQISTSGEAKNSESTRERPNQSQAINEPMGYLDMLAGEEVLPQLPDESEVIEQPLICPLTVSRHTSGNRAGLSRQGNDGRRLKQPVVQCPLGVNCPSVSPLQFELLIQRPNIDYETCNGLSDLLKLLKRWRVGVRQQYLRALRRMARIARQHGAAPLFGERINREDPAEAAALAADSSA